MNKKTTDYGWIGWAVAVIISAAYIFSPLFAGNSSQESNTAHSAKPSTLISQPEESQQNLELVQDDDSWQCVDATSYNQNAYDDNKCTKGDEIQYVSDSQALELDPSYSPGKSGANYYNNQ